jgi:hypothetical protein
LVGEEFTSVHGEKHGMYVAYMIFRMSNVTVTLFYNGRRPGTRAIERAAASVATALEAARPAGH